MSLRVLYVSSEITPFQDEFNIGSYLDGIPQHFFSRGMDVRILLPCFATINKRKHRLHDVNRLSGNTICIGEEDIPLYIKVSSVPKARFQAYFLDNPEIFKKKNTLVDPSGNFLEDNDNRMTFFCKGVLETVKQFGWVPNIIHCLDWITSLIPLYVKTSYRRDPIYKSSKVIYSLFNHHFTHQFFEDIVDKIKHRNISKATIQEWTPNNYENILAMGTHFCDKVVACETKLEGASKNVFSQIDKDKQHVIPKSEDYIKQYIEVYDSLLA